MPGMVFVFRNSVCDHHQGAESGAHVFTVGQKPVEVRWGREEASLGFQDLGGRRQRERRGGRSRAGGRG